MQENMSENKDDKDQSYSETLSEQDSKIDQAWATEERNPQSLCIY